jgi:hypothetical protein
VTCSANNIKELSSSILSEPVPAASSSKNSDDKFGKSQNIPLQLHKKKILSGRVEGSKGQ